MVEESAAPRSQPYQAPYAGADMPPPPTATGGHMVRNVLMLISLVVMLIAAGGGYLVASRAATRDRIDAAKAVRTIVDQHHADVNTKLKAIFASVGDVTGTNFDATKVKAGLDKATVQVDALKTSDTNDIGRIRTATGKVQDRSFLTAISSSALDREHSRLDAYRSALQMEIAEIESVKQQLGIVGDLMTTVVQLKPLIDDLTANNTAAGEKDYATPSATLDKLVAEASSAPDTPSKMKEFLTLFRSEITHIKAVLDGVQSHSVSQVQAAQAAVQKDLDALQKFDTAAMQKQYEELGTQLDAKVTAELRKAR
jgi:hypothetical protein